MDWKNLNNINFENVKQARLQLHQAIQLISACGISFAEHKKDDSHTSMEYLSEKDVFCGTAFTEMKLKLALHFSSLFYHLLDQNLETISSFSLSGKTQQQAVKWLLDELQNKGFNTDSFSMDKHYEIPANDQAKGAEYFLIDTGKPFGQLNNQFSNACIALKQIADKNADSSNILLWPHHFDLGLLLNIKKGATSEESKTISLGFSPGDENYEQPYYYVSPWPYPDKKILSAYKLPFGHWHSESFIAAVFTAEHYTDKEQQQDITLTFLESAVTFCKDILKR